MINVTLKGGEIRQYEAGTTALDVAKALGSGLYKLPVHAKSTGSHAIAHRVAGWL